MVEKNEKHPVHGRATDRIAIDPRMRLLGLALLGSLLRPHEPETKTPRKTPAQRVMAARAAKPKPQDYCPGCGELTYTDGKLCEDCNA